MGAQRSHLHQRRKSQKPRCARWHARANIASQLQLDSLDLDVVVVVDSALGLVDVVLVVVVGVVQHADCSGLSTLHYGHLGATAVFKRVGRSRAWAQLSSNTSALHPFANNHNPSLLGDC